MYQCGIWPAGVRVETLAGALVQANWQLPSTGTPDPLGEPNRRPDGLVALGGTGGGGWTMRIEEVDADYPRARFDR